MHFSQTLMGEFVNEMQFITIPICSQLKFSSLNFAKHFGIIFLCKGEFVLKGFDTVGYINFMF